MNPYRQNCHQTDVVRKPRGKYKTKWLRFQIWLFGSWKERFYRCHSCNAAWPHRAGPEIDFEPLIHELFECPKRK